MNDPEVISYVQDEMLKDPNVDARFVYKITDLAVMDEDMFDLMVRWMEASIPTEREWIEQDMRSLLMDIEMYGN